MYVTDVAGLRSGVNPVSGTFSVGATGRAISGGELAEPADEFTIASDLSSMLAAVRATGSEARWVPFGGSVSTPALLIGEMAIGGVMAPEPSGSVDRPSAAELKERLEAEQRGLPFLVYRDGGEQVIAGLDPERERLTLGRGRDVDLRVDDPEVSRVRRAPRTDGEWTVLDDDLSHNGTFVNGRRIRRRRRLATSISCGSGRPRSPSASPAARVRTTPLRRPRDGRGSIASPTPSARY